MIMKIDKQNGDMCFNEEAHVYFNLKDPKRKYTSVTTLIHQFEQPFDKDFWSGYKALQQLVDPDYWKLLSKELRDTKTITPKLLQNYGVDIDDYNSVQQNILDMWQAENLASTQRGSEIHSKLEHSFYTQKTDISLQKYGVGGKFVCVEGKTELDLENGVYPEYLIYYESPDGKLNLAGQIDLLVKEGTSFSIIDWKGLPLDTKIPTYTGWTTMGEIKVGDKVFDMNGEPCSVIHKSEIHHNPCYRITFETGEQIVADEDHNWLVRCREFGTVVMTTKELAEHIGNGVKFTIQDPKPLKLPKKKIIYNFDDDEGIKDTIIAALRADEDTRRYIVSKLYKEHGYDANIQESMYIPKKCWTPYFVELARTLGTKIYVDRSGSVWVHWDHMIMCGCYEAIVGHRKISYVEPVETVPTQCIEVDSLTHTSLCTEAMIVTHNTNKQIKTSSYFDRKTKTSEKPKYPLNTLDNCNFNTYNMQLSTYAWMIQQIHPDWKCKDLVLVHFDHDNKMTTYNMDYLKDHVEKMLSFYKKTAILDEHKAKRKRIEY